MDGLLNGERAMDEKIVRSTKSSITRERIGTEYNGAAGQRET